MSRKTAVESVTYLELGIYGNIEQGYKRVNNVTQCCYNAAK